MPKMCPKLTTNKYLKRHNDQAAIFQKKIWQHYGIKTCRTPWKHHPDPVARNVEVKVLWDSVIQTDTHDDQARRSNVVVIDKAMLATTIKDVAVHLDWKVKYKEDEKIMKYQDLRIEIQKL